MRKRFLMLSVAIGFAATLLFLLQPETCYACTDQAPPHACGVNLSAATVQQAVEKEGWWTTILPGDPKHQAQTVNIYLGINHNSGITPVGYEYDIAYGGDWNPDAAGIVTPTMGTGILGAAGSADASDTIQLTFPYTPTDSGDLVVTATVQSTDGQCAFRAPVTTTVRVSDTAAPTVWPITPRTCPKPGDTREISFGIHNATNTTQTYLAQASVSNPTGGSASDLFNLNGSGPSAELEPFELGAGDTERVNVSCETFGMCIVGGENRVNLTVAPELSPTQQSLAWSNVTLRSPDVDCNEIEDWWLIAPPLFLLALFGIPALAAIGTGGYIATRKPASRPTQRPDQRTGGEPRREIKDKSPTGKGIQHGRKPKRRGKK